jgi:hypothetical protein
MSGPHHVTARGATTFRGDQHNTRLLAYTAGEPQPQQRRSAEWTNADRVFKIIRHEPVSITSTKTWRPTWRPTPIDYDLLYWLKTACRRTHVSSLRCGPLRRRRIRQR